MATEALDSGTKEFAGEMLIRGIALAFGCALAQIVLACALAYVGLGDFALFATPVVIAMAHGFFVVALADWGMRRVTGDLDDATLPPLDVAIAGALTIGLPALAILGIHAFAPYGLTRLPWGLAGWTLMVVTALPVRIAALVRRRRIAFRSLWRRLPTLLLASVPTCGLGYILADAPAGIMDGGMIVMPLAMLFMFGASTLAAMLSVAALRPAG
jgi:hypothetical protein